MCVCVKCEVCVVCVCRLMASTLQHSYTVEYYSVVKRSRALIHIATRTDPETEPGTEGLTACEPTTMQYPNQARSLTQEAGHRLPGAAVGGRVCSWDGVSFWVHGMFWKEVEVTLELHCYRAVHSANACHMALSSIKVLGTQLSC